MNKIMVVDDEVIIAKQLGERLEDMGYNVTGKAYSGAEAIAMAGMNRQKLTLRFRR